ncbi:SdiA-regulated domain-containing protein [Pedobacter frigidisoli]|uniref:SdiA-regulated domain-containing protein n=1 Tax=Pedobacter frigidisoli TaxID=2530455 RepID=UPI0029307214|nr:SdiA-regulated domain-containing protein [Pedobacter frigidisoli]
MKKNKNRIATAFALSALVFVAASCVNEKHEEQSSTEKSVTASAPTAFPYDLDDPVKYNMPQNLFEISGIVFHKGDSKEVFAIQDEDGDLFHLGLSDKESKFTKFGGKGDYEDVTIINDYVIVLKSNGELHTFPISGINGAEAKNVVKTKDLVPKAEYEGLAADEKAGKIFVLTKEVKKGKANQTDVFSFKFNAGKFTSDKTYSLPFKEIAEVAGDSKIKFRPSALAKNPATGEWYILSSINKLLLVTDAEFKIKSAYPLKRSFFNQPEGIAFDKDNNLYISNEGGTLAAGNILLFKLKK